MGERQTVSESKAIFHKEFPFVVPAVYRRLIDELIVELNLLSHQEDFEPDGMFSLGLTSIFNEFSKGYQPETQKSKILPAICKATGLSFQKIQDFSNNAKDLANKISIEEIKDASKGNKNKEEANLIKGIIKVNNHYSRIIAIGLFKFYEAMDVLKTSSQDDTLIRDLSSYIGIKKERFDKDVSIYKSNIDKIEKALELIQLNIKDEKRRSKEKKENQEANTE
ncbi:MULTISPECIES: photosystem II biogenesis protein Psp29 [Prochlorococcus]|uniref:photosystem II biogenesis protein Psp29 n=1 Tax=Prochlorococcus TaxID=1218 RepID=UPI0005339120|nr:MULTISPECIES: photosystem II biogenesis protein Psp29 [Prochlorococcus]KGG12501.1 hypothetical protein EV05_1713 [Prochlorococcus sp. MIT 0601]